MSDELNDFDFSRWPRAWSLREGVTYLNHGSFGPTPDVVRDARQRWFAELESEPMDFYVRRLEPLLDAAAERLGRFVGCRADDLIFVPNATVGMNLVAASIGLQPDDEVLLTDHEYGAVVRIWGRACADTQAKTVLAHLPRPLQSTSELVDALFARVTPRTRLIVVSHVTSQTAAIFPVAEICRRARERNISVCVDGPHAVAMVPLQLSEIGCDYYTASCHKWLSAPLGSGFLYVRGRHKSELQPVVTSWGRSLSGRPASWKDEFHWFGTYDPSGYLSIPDAIEFLELVGLEQFRSQTHALARYAREQVLRVTGGEALVPDDPQWYGPMATITLPRVPKSEAWPGQPHPLQVALWERFQIEIPVFEWQGTLCLRVSCHLYNTPADVDRLVQALGELVPAAG
jgi:isopenicillin-N epimerase